jgi:hypothetical protein
MAKNLPAPLPDDESPESAGEFLLYQTEDGQTRIDVRMADETVWLSQRHIAELFEITVPTVNEHLKGIYEERELDPAATIRKFRIVQTEGPRQVSRDVDHYNLDAVLAVGYRVRSHRGTQFRIWATGRLREYLIKGFAMDDRRLKQAGGGDYFEELLARIRDIRSSERVFWRKVLDIYATSIDYDPAADASQLFFKTVQNKMHWAAHGHTAAEIVYKRADASQPHMGLTTWAGDKPRKTDVTIAKNYLAAEEIDALNRIVTAYLEFAELQALNRRAMHMADWIGKLDDFLRLSDREILTHAGKISHEAALLKAEGEFAKYRRAQAALPQPVDEHFEKSMEELKQIEKQKPPAPKRKGKRPTKKKSGKKAPKGKKRKPPRSGEEE